AGIAATRARTIIPGRDELGTGEELRFADGPRLQVEHLHETGRRRIAFAGSGDARLVDLVRERRGLADATVRELTGTGLVASADITGPDDAAELVARWAADGVDGVVAYN